MQRCERESTRGLSSVRRKRKRNLGLSLSRLSQLWESTSSMCTVVPHGLCSASRLLDAEDRTGQDGVGEVR